MGCNTHIYKKSNITFENIKPKIDELLNSLTLKSCEEMGWTKARKEYIKIVRLRNYYFKGFIKSAIIKKLYYWFNEYEVNKILFEDSDIFARSKNNIIYISETDYKWDGDNLFRGRGFRNDILINMNDVIKYLNKPNSANVNESNFFQVLNRVEKFFEEYPDHVICFG